MILEREGMLELAQALAISHLRLGVTALELKDANSAIKDTSRALSLFANQKAMTASIRAIPIMLNAL